MVDASTLLPLSGVSKAAHRELFEGRAIL